MVLSHTEVAMARLVAGHVGPDEPPVNFLVDSMPPGRSWSPAPVEVSGLVLMLLALVPSYTNT